MSNRTGAAGAPNPDGGQSTVGISHVAGLPPHPLIVHGTAALVPPAALAFVATAWRRAWRRVYSLAVA